MLCSGVRWSHTVDVPRPRTRFVTAPDGARLAYQVIGEGDRDVVFVPDWLSSIDLMWEHPASARFLDSLSELGRLVLFDHRGSGGSDPATFDHGAMGAAFEQGAADLVTILDAVESTEVDVVTTSIGVGAVFMLSATSPARIRRLVAQDPAVRLVNADDYPYAMTQDTLDALVDNVERYWGQGTSVLYFAPELWPDTALRDWLGRYERLATTRTFMLDCWRSAPQTDLRQLLPLVQAETLVISHTGNPMVNHEQGRYIASSLPNARFVSLDGSNVLPWADQRVADHIREFLGQSGDPVRETDRVLATVLFTDIVDSTSRLASVGDRTWRHLLDEHDRLGSGLVERFRGRIVKRTGDGLLAMFDGPARAVRCAIALTEACPHRIGVELRAGLHTGEVEVRGEDLGGISVHIAARVMAHASGGEVVATRTVRDLTTGSGLAYRELGAHPLKGVPDPWELYAVTD